MKQRITGRIIEERGDLWYQISHHQGMAPFFMTITNPDNLYLFAGSQGGITAGRRDINSALFPYYSVDKLYDNSENTGSKTLLRVQEEERSHLWEPLSSLHPGLYQLSRHILKSLYGNKVILREINHDLELEYDLQWTASPRYGVVKTSHLKNRGTSPRRIELLDGIQNTLPPHGDPAIQDRFSNLLDAYKRSERVPETDLGIFTLSARLTDLAEPSEALSATTWWQAGLPSRSILLASDQINRFRQGEPMETERDRKGVRGAFLVHSSLDMKPGEERSWLFCGEVDQSRAGLEALLQEMENPSRLRSRVEEDIRRAGLDLERIIGINDGLQTTGSSVNSAHHSINVLLNVMRGGYFAMGNRLPSADFRRFLQGANRETALAHEAFLASLPPQLTVDDLKERIDDRGDADLQRLAREYLPLTFSRRHGDPSRPWNRFAIDPWKPDGTPRLQYQGNWRDIFQNWEALLQSHPPFTESVITKFINATTADGYNPYRLSQEGIDWEKPEPDNPWANIGYWSDHQIIYLVRLLELSENYYPGSVKVLLRRKTFVYAQVPYEIKPFSAILQDPRNTIVFNTALDRQIEERSARMGSDGRLHLDSRGRPRKGSLAEKLLILVLAKMANFVADGGIWMNTQRPEWNDANNALVGTGISLVTLYALQRMLRFLLPLTTGEETYALHREVLAWMRATAAALGDEESRLGAPFSPEARYSLLCRLGEAAGSYRRGLYERGLGDEKEEIPGRELRRFFSLCRAFLDDTASRSRREDHLYHAYNRLELNQAEATAHVHPLYAMLEGQAAGLGTGAAEPQQALAALESLRRSPLYREDQKSYMLYPHRELPGYRDKNNVTRKAIKAYPALAERLSDETLPGLERDNRGLYHFESWIRNSRDLREGAAGLSAEELTALEALFEETFNHQAFTGRSGTFFAYEGLGSIYWHMVSKLLLSVQECAFQALDRDQRMEAEALRARYFEVEAGLGYKRSPAEYGAFPLDPYSHTPAHSGAKQPGMTGQVKEEVITRLAETGLRVREGRLTFTDFFVQEEEYLSREAEWITYPPEGERRKERLPAGSFGLTFCRVPIQVSRAPQPSLTLVTAEGEELTRRELSCTAAESRSLFGKKGEIRRILVTFGQEGALLTQQQWKS